MARRAAGALFAFFAAGLFACESSEHGSDASSRQAEHRTLAAQISSQFDGALTHRCDCLVAQGLLYESTDMCLESLSWPASAADCLAAAFDRDGTDELRAALRCHIDHLEDANACAEAVSCEQLLIEGACDELTATNPCGEAVVDLFAFAAAHCPELRLPAQ